MEYLLVDTSMLMSFSPHASFGCDSGFFSLAAFVLCVVFLLKKWFGTQG
ncbi:MAG: hypothetical protein FWG71_10780 [Synergistaceae bacterium]|nr:hypothetical protein [Synergistaceae bacterium]